MMPEISNNFKKFEKREREKKERENLNQRDKIKC